MTEQMVKEYISGDPQVWTRWLEEAKLIELTKYGEPLDLVCKIGITASLYQEIIPYAEEAVRGISIDERIGEVLTLFVKYSKLATRDYMEFPYRFQSWVKAANWSDDEGVQVDEAKRSFDKTVTVVAGMMIDDNGEPAILLAKKEE